MQFVGWPYNILASENRLDLSDFLSLSRLRLAASLTPPHFPTYCITGKRYWSNQLLLSQVEHFRNKSFESCHVSQNCKYLSVFQSVSALDTKNSVKDYSSVKERVLIKSI